LILLVDNFDSFTYNLVDYFEQLGQEVEVIRNDVNPESVNWKKYHGLVLSPGPETPEKANFLLQYLEKAAQNVPILGICLGHQAINIHFGGTIKKGLQPMHGKISIVKKVNEDLIFNQLPIQFNVVRYHSLIIDDLGKDLVVLGETALKETMIIKHSLRPIYGIQYHPESILTQFGLKILENWLQLAGISN
jgi:anthranilate synthase/aminodeoxychorismate synthase-like glutamine amidotransferase